MPLSREAMDKLVDDHFRYEATADLEGVMSTYAEDPHHALKGERAENVMRVYGDELIVDETILIGEVVDGRPFSLEGKRGREVRVRLLHVFRIRDGLIANEKVWFDADEMRAQLK